jgi:hypothetical protein
MLTKDEYVSEMKKRLDEWSREIDAWEVKADEFKEDAKVKYQEQLVALRAKREEGEKKLAELQSATETSWEHLKAGSESVWEALKDSAKTFQSHFK